MSRDKKQSWESVYSRDWSNNSFENKPLKRDLDTKVVAITDKLKKLNLVTNNDIKNIVLKDTELLKSLCSIPGQSKNTSKISKYIIELIEAISLQNPKANITVDVDNTGNICVCKNSDTTITTYPTYVSHIDTVHRHTETPEVLLTSDDTLVAYRIFNSRVEQVGVGGDDRVGVFCCIKALEILPNCKVVFFTDEEIGCVGSNAVDMTFFKDSQFVVQLDRRGNTDFINFTNGCDVSSKEFTKDFMENLNTTSTLYSTNSGTVTDVGTLRKRGLQVSSCNLSCGYYEAHCNTEYIDLYDCLLAIYSSISFAAISNKVYEFPKEVIEEKSSLTNTDFKTPFNSNRIKAIAELSELKGNKKNVTLQGLKLNSEKYSTQFTSFAVGVAYGLGYEVIIDFNKTDCSLCGCPKLLVKEFANNPVSNVCIGCLDVTYPNTYGIKL